MYQTLNICMKDEYNIQFYSNLKNKKVKNKKNYSKSAKLKKKYYTINTLKINLDIE